MVPHRNGQFTTRVGFDFFIVYLPCFQRAGEQYSTSLLMWLLLVVVTVGAVVIVLSRITACKKLGLRSQIKK